MGDILYYNQPADIWEKALSLGNGSMGAMVYGGVELERIQMNLDTLWSGTVREKQTIDKRSALENIRGLILAEDYKKACNMADEEFTAEKSANYMPLGEIQIKYFTAGALSEYRRSLNMKTAVCEVSYMRGPTYEPKCKYCEKVYISYPHKAMIIEISSARKNTISFALSLNSELKSDVRYDGDIADMTGKAPYVADWFAQSCSPLTYDDTKNTVRYALRAKVAVSGGEVLSDKNAITVHHADKAYIIVAAETNFVIYDKEPDISADLLGICNKRIETVINDGFDKVLREHIADYGRLYDRTQLTLGDSEDMPTDVRLERFKKGYKDADLIAAVFNFGRYLLISSSRVGTQTANLQGIWNNLIQPPWASNYTVNINTEMNYWLAESCGLAELCMPLIEMIKELSEAGKITAKQYYGCEGFCVHHNVDLWRKTTPSENSSKWALWPMAGGWLCRHLWEHFEYSGNMEFLKETAYPITEECVKFFLDFMIKDDNGDWITCPSTSPENAFKYEGEICWLTKASTMDISIIRELFGNYIEMCSILDKHNEIEERVQTVSANLPEIRLAPDGRIAEWCGDFEETERGHRHLSHLYGLYPSNLITEENPRLFLGAKKSLETRIENGSGMTGWSGAWIINLFARLKDGKSAAQYAERFIKISLYDSLLDVQPPYQIDGNLGFTAGIAEMLVQSQNGYIEMLPAAGGMLSDGSVSGLYVRGGFVIDMKWVNGEIKQAFVTALNGGICRVKAKGMKRIKNNEAVNDYCEINIDAGEKYEIEF